MSRFVAVAALAAVVLVLSVPAGAGAVSGELRQIGSPLECVSESGLLGECQDGRTLNGVTAIAVSPDGDHAYAAATVSDAVTAFARDPASRTLAPLPGTAACVSETGTGGQCADGRALNAASAVAVSPDGRHVYVAAAASSAVSAFARNPSTGALTQLPGSSGCVGETTAAGCADGRALVGATALEVSADGRHVYVAARTSGAIVVLRRDGTTGALSQAAGAAGCISESGTSGTCRNGRALVTAAGVAASPDGDHVYAAATGSDAVVTLARDGSTGALTQAAGAGGCVARTTAAGCRVAEGLDGATGVDVAPDGQAVYAAAVVSDAVTAFGRDPGTGALAQFPGGAGCRSSTGAGSCEPQRALNGVRAVEVRPAGAPDGQPELAAAAELSDAVSLFWLEAPTGGLRGAGCANHRGWESVPSERCEDAEALDGAAAATWAPDGRDVYAAARVSDAVSGFLGGGHLSPVELGDPVADLPDAAPYAQEPITSGADRLVISPDGAHAYSWFAGCVPISTCDEDNFVSGIQRMRRDAATGALTFTGCLGAPGCPETAGGPTGGHLAVSPDGKHLYAAARDAVSLFARNATTGALTFVRTTPLRGALFPTDIAVSPGGEDVYVLGTWGTLARLRRTASTGALVQPAGTAGCIARDGSDGCATGRLPGSAGSVHVSPDGTGAYVIGEGASSSAAGMLAVLRRDTATGGLTQPPGSAGCISHPAQDGCAAHPAIAQARHLAISPDGADVYVTSLAKPTVQQFRRNRTTSALTTGACVVPRTLGTCSSPLPHASGTAVAASPDGRSVYALAAYVVAHQATPGGSGITYRLLAAFARNTTSGALTQLPGLAGCTTETGARTCRDGRRIDAGIHAEAQLVASPDGRFLYTRTTGFRRIP